MAKKRSGTAKKVQGIFAPGTGKATDPDHVRKYLTDDDARELLSRLVGEHGKPHDALSFVDQAIVKRLHKKRDDGFTNPELVVLIHIQGVMAAISETEL